MGLDMYLNGEKYIWTDWEHPSKNPMEDGFKLKTKTLELGYWRKHPNLHGYIVNTFAGGKDECQEIPLDVDNLKQLLKDVKADWQSLPEDKEPTIKIIEGAIKWLGTEEKGVARSVTYRASW
jgi:hypothetical protein